VPPNNGGFPLAEGEQTWVGGILSPYDNNSDNTNTTYLAESLLGPYLGLSFGLWRCPSDFSVAREVGVVLPRVRSYSMNNLINNSALDYPLQPFKVIRRTSDMVNPAPCGTFVILDEREDSIDDAVFLVDMWNGPASLGDLPAAHHKGAANLVFGDNHVEPHKWLDPRTQPPISQDGYVAISWAQGGANPDVLWLQTHASGPR
jgi:prepilin-type processing-associated H-X9-DG protein